MAIFANNIVSGNKEEGAVKAPTSPTVDDWKTIKNKIVASQPIVRQNKIVKEIIVKNELPAKYHIIEDGELIKHINKKSAYMSDLTTESD